MRNNPDFECELDVITPDPTILHGEDRWRIVGNDMMVMFWDSQISPTEVDSFMQRWGLEMVKDPYATLSRDLDWSYIFRNVHPERCGSRKVIDIVRDIMVVDSALVKFAEPDILNLLEPHSNDPMYPSMWHVENNGQLLSSIWAGNPDADSDIAEAWNKGYTGAGIRVAVIDFHGFQNTHPDMIGVYDVAKSKHYLDDTLPIFQLDLSGQRNSHGQQMAGVIGAKKDNNSGGAGVAPDVVIGAFLITPSPAQAVSALEDILGFGDYDIINMSWDVGEGFASFNQMIDALDNHQNDGRNRKGTIMISSAGNLNWVDIRWPGRHPGVYSIGATTPTDSVKIAGDRWDIYGSGSWGSNYGLGVDFAAPGVFITTPDLEGSAGVVPGDYYGTYGTSAAAGIASGIAAMILQMDTSLSSTGPGSVYEFLRAGADQVSNYNYNFFWPSHPGKSEEVGYGRLNACNTLNLVSLDQEMAAFQASFRVAQLSDGEVRAYYDLTEVRGDFALEIIDIQGRVMQTVEINRGRQWMSIPTEGLAPAMYFARLRGGDQSLSDTEKFVIFR